MEAAGLLDTSQSDVLNMLKGFLSIIDELGAVDTERGTHSTMTGTWLELATLPLY